ncbi:hypothetical protein ACFTZB_33180 [Rhodococcus sp. NPDC057014]|uniref:hypothetical protein n=1 Tax=Rhodococcus sp. NPDC057014 TaxID=3346000 RepID=UPI0036253033
MSRPWEQIALFDVHEPSAPDPATDEAVEIDAEDTAAEEPPTPITAPEPSIPAVAAEPSAVPEPEPATKWFRP